MLDDPYSDKKPTASEVLDSMDDDFERDDDSPLTKQ